MNSVRAIMGATQVGGKGSRRGRRVYGGQEGYYGFDCRCSDGAMTQKWKDARNKVKAENALLPFLSPKYMSNEEKLKLMREDLKKTTDPVKREELRAQIEELKVSMQPRVEGLSPGQFSSSSQQTKPSKKGSKYADMTDDQLLQELEKEKIKIRNAPIGSPAYKEATGRRNAIVNNLNRRGIPATLGGARRRKARKANSQKYKKFLDGLDVKRLQKIAKTKGIKITKKKDGKTVYCKKDTIVSKLFKFKYGK